MFAKCLMVLAFLFCFLTISGQTNSRRQKSIGDTIVVSTLRNKKVHKEKFYLKDQLVLEKKYYFRKAFYACLIKKPDSLNKKAVAIKAFWTNGKPRIDGFSLDGKKPEGLYRTFYENGQPQCICNYKDGKRDGIQLYHFDNGQVKSQIMYVNGVPWSIIGCYTKDGKVSQEGTLKEGNGTFFIYNKRENLSKVEYYKSGVLIKTEKLKSNHFNSYGTNLP